MSKTFLEKPQGTIPGPLDAEFHVIQLGFGGASGMSPEKLIDASQEVDNCSEGLISAGIYSDIPPQMADTIEESEHTIEVAVRRSFDFMKLPLILGGNSEILPAVRRGLDDQLGTYVEVVAEKAGEIEGDNLVITLDGDALPEIDFASFSDKLSIERVGAVVVIGSGDVDYSSVAKKVVDLLNAIA